MKNTYIFKSERLGFRNWKNSDLDSFVKMNSDEKVMEFFPNTLSPQESQSNLEKIQLHFEQKGYTWFAVEELSSQNIIGFIGLWYQNFDFELAPFVEIGWRLIPPYWGKGYATEGAKACIQYGFNTLELDSIYSMTAIVNKRSERVMQKIGMCKITEFNHPKLAKGNWLERHLLYKITQ